MLALPVALVAAALVPATSGTPAAGSDFGDAPDGAPAGYAGKLAVRGKFPSKAASGGPRHSASGPRIGIGWSGEGDSRQVNRDVDNGAQLVGRSCAMSTVTFVLDASRVPAGTPILVNAWFDWNQDGDWGEGGNARCGPEWGIQNLRLEPAEPVTAVTLRFRAGKLPRQFWWRLQVHAGEPASHAAGAQVTPSNGGETEDHFYEGKPPKEADGVRLWTWWKDHVAAHGRNVLVRFILDGPGRFPLDRFAVTRVSHLVFGDTKGIRVNRNPVVRGSDFLAFSVWIRSTEHERKRVVQSVFVTLTVDVVVAGRKRTLRHLSLATFVHRKGLSPPFEPPPNTGPAPIGAAIDPIRPDPVKARCSARFTPFGFTPGVAGAQGGVVEARCEGVDVRSMSVSAGGGGQKIASFNGNCAPVTVNGVERRAVRCLPRRPNKATIVGFDYRTDSPFASATVHVLAGGNFGTGTTIVLRQTFFFPREGMACSQSIPAATSCATIP